MKSTKHINLDFIPPAAAEDYAENTGDLISYVDNEMISRPDITSLVGDNGIGMMKINHMNHAAFMSVVFQLNRFELLESTLPWVYRAYHNHGFSYEYFKAALQTWINAVNKHLKPENAGSVLTVYKWMINRHQENIGLSLIEFNQTYQIDSNWLSTYKSFLKSLINGDTYRCSEIAHNACRTKDDIKAFYLNVAQPALYHIGDLWESGEINVSAEHLATAIVTRTILQLSYLYKQTADQSRRVMVLCISGEYHQLGAMMVANCFEMDDWSVNYLADNVPFRDTMQHIAAFKPHLLALSVTMPYNISSMSELIKKIRSGGYHESMKILAGGQAFKIFPDLPEFLGADEYAADCNEAVKAGRRLLGLVF